MNKKKTASAGLKKAEIRAHEAVTVKNIEKVQHEKETIFMKENKLTGGELYNIGAVKTKDD